MFCCVTSNRPGGTRTEREVDCAIQPNDAANLRRRTGGGGIRSFPSWVSSRGPSCPLSCRRIQGAKARGPSNLRTRHAANTTLGGRASVGVQSSNNGQALESLSQVKGYALSESCLENQYSCRLNRAPGYLRAHPDQEGGSVPVVGRQTLDEMSLRGAFTSAVRAYAARGTTDLVLNLLSPDR